jgi:hypothetical protein
MNLNFPNLPVFIVFIYPDAADNLAIYDDLGELLRLPPGIKVQLLDFRFPGTELACDHTPVALLMQILEVGFVGIVCRTVFHRDQLP